MIIISAARRRRTPPPATLANLFGRAGGFARDVTLLPRRSMPHAARMIGLEIKDDRKVISGRSISPGGRATRSPRVSRCAHDLFISIQKLQRLRGCCEMHAELPWELSGSGLYIGVD